MNLVARLNNLEKILLKHEIVDTSLLTALEEMGYSIKQRITAKLDTSSQQKFDCSVCALLTLQELEELVQLFPIQE